jgi:hypothetical protein
MKIAYIGNFSVDFSTESHIAKSFESLGHEVIRIPESKATIAGVASVDCDFVLYTKTRNILGDWSLIKVPTVAWCLDLYIGLQREVELDHHPFWKCDIVITPDGGHQKEFEKHGINHFYVPAGVYDKECYIGDVKESMQKDVIFVGSMHYHPEWPYRRELIKWLMTTYGDRFRLWGTNETVRGKDLNNLYASAKVVVGDSLYSPRYWSDRIYETMGRGGFLIHPKIIGLEEEFEYGKHFVSYNYKDFDGLRRKIDYYLAHPEEREEIRMAGHEFVKNNCTYVDRCKQVLKIVEDERIKNPKLGMREVARGGQV